jgi:hypothetical protein
MGQLRDIRADLDARLIDIEADIAAEEERHRCLLEELARRRQLVKQMLEVEQRHWGQAQPSLFGAILVPAEEGRKTPLTDLVCDIMSDGQPWSLERLTQAAEARGWNFRGKSPRRALHFTLLSLKNKGYAEMPRSQCWRLLTEGAGGERGKAVANSPAQ